MPRPTINTLLEQQVSRPVIRRGSDFEFSASQSDERSVVTEQRISRDTEIQKYVNTEPQQTQYKAKSRVGWEIRTDLLKAMKIHAVQEGKKDYEVVEEAMELYLQKRQ
jgi:hypothetical protein